MDTEKIKTAIFKNRNRKITIGVRVYPELKLKLAEQAKQLGMSVSEHCENYLSNMDALLLEKGNALKEAEAFKAKVLQLNTNMVNFSARI